MGNLVATDTNQATPLCIVQASTSPKMAVSGFAAHCLTKAFNTGTVYDEKDFPTAELSTFTPAGSDQPLADPEKAAIECIYGNLLEFYDYKFKGRKFFEHMKRLNFLFGKNISFI